SGNVKMSLFNNENIPPALMDGKDILPGHRQDEPISGIMFYNNSGDECGGLIYGNEQDDDGNNVYTGASLTFDQYKQDQVVQMHYEDEGGERRYGFSIYDRPETPLPDQITKREEISQSQMSDAEKEAALREAYAGHAPRAFMGKNENGDVSVQLNDSKGQARMRMVVDANDVPRMEFLDEKGNVTYTLPPE